MRASATPRVNKGERGQILIMFVVMLTLIFIAGAMAIDYGLWLGEKRGIARASDLAVLAAVQDLPADNAEQVYTSWSADCAAIPACDAAFEWAERNNYGEAQGATVEVSFFCSNDIDAPPDGICYNENQDVGAFPLSLCPSDGDETGCDTVRVIVEKGAVDLFGTFFGGVDFDIGASAFARVEFVVSPVDIAISIDTSGSMNDGCNGSQSNVGCPIREARNASKSFAETILGDDPDNSPSQVGYAPHRACYLVGGGDGCVPSINLPPSSSDCNDTDDSWVLCLGRDLDLIEEKIDATQPNNQTNICLGLWAAGEIVLGPGAQDPDDVEGLGRFIVILTDGDNVFQPHPTVNPACWPHSNGDPGAPPPPNRCGQGPGGDDRDLDRCTYDVALDLEDEGVEIYVIGLSVETDGNSDLDEIPGDDFNCNGIGGTSSSAYLDTVWDRRLLKCVASSTAGTNDHYYETDDAANLPAIFQGIAYEIATRGLTGIGNGG